VNESLPQPGTPDWLIRPYRGDDEAPLVALWRDCGLTRPWNDAHKDIARKLAVQPELLLVAVTGSELAGSVMAGYEGHRGWINYLAVAPARRRGGLGRALMAAAEERLRALGCPKINLQVRADNEAVLAFYRRIGYVQEDFVSLGRRLVDDRAPDQGGKAAP
jgi:ribosomal protein S18 acetylase RimI-like enzyme